jgi:hypothetical protein
MPGKFASPLVPGMILPVLDDWLFGAVGYLWALLVCLHRGKWWGTRGLVVLSGVALGLLHLNTWGFLWLPWVAAGFYFLAARCAMAEQAYRLKGRRHEAAALLCLHGMGAQMAVLFLLVLLRLIPWGRTITHLGNFGFYITREGDVFWQSLRFGKRSEVGTSGRLRWLRLLPWLISSKFCGSGRVTDKPYYSIFRAVVFRVWFGMLERGSGWLSWRFQACWPFRPTKFPCSGDCRGTRVCFGPGGSFYSACLALFCFGLRQGGEKACPARNAKPCARWRRESALLAEKVGPSRNPLERKFLRRLEEFQTLAPGGLFRM